MGGIGGGGLNVPIILTILEKPYTEAVSLSLCAVLGNTGAQVWLVFNIYIFKSDILFLFFVFLASN